MTFPDEDTLTFPTLPLFLSLFLLLLSLVLFVVADGIVFSHVAWQPDCGYKPQWVLYKQGHFTEWVYFSERNDLMERADIERYCPHLRHPETDPDTRLGAGNRMQWR